jgi:hypothetical protein
MLARPLKWAQVKGRKAELTIMNDVLTVIGVSESFWLT